MNMNNLMSLVIAFSITVILLHKLKPLALRINLVDHPDDDRKYHEGKIPLIGGLAMFCGFMLALLFLEQPLSGLRSLIAGSAILMIVGILDDFRDLPPGTRFFAQMLVALVIIVEDGAILRNLGTIGWTSGDIELGLFFGGFLTILAVIMAINAINMVDGIDGLAGGLTLVTLSNLAFISWMGGVEELFVVLLLLIATILAFLIFNLRYPGQPRAKVFMGDAGSMFLGFLVVWFLIVFSQGEHRSMTPVTALWIFALPLLDTGSTSIRRILKGRSPFEADREHFHHLLLDVGFTVTQVVVILVGSAICLALIGLIGLYFLVPETVMFWTFMVVFVLVFFFCRYLKRLGTAQGL